MDILFEITKPARLTIGNGVQDRIKTANLKEGNMPWWVLSDVLITKDREFVGIVLFAGDEDIITAANIAANCDPAAVRFYSPQQADQIPRYRCENPIAAILEISWSSLPIHEVEVAQLSEDWYYDPEKGEEFPVAWGYPGIDHILESMQLILPPVTI